jgi:HSP20 family protein
MSIVKRTENNMPSMFDNMFKTDWLGGTSNANNIGVSIPAVNIKEDENVFSVDVAAPGKSKKDFNIELDNGTLIISSESKDENAEEENNAGFTRREFSYSNFKRAFSLPDSVDMANISAKYKNGVLTIGLPKKEESKVQAKRMIDVS